MKNLPTICFPILCLIGYFAYDYGERWITAQERIADATVESCDVLAEFRGDVQAVVVAQELTDQTFKNWLSGNTTVEGVKLAIGSQGVKIETLKQRVK